LFRDCDAWIGSVGQIAIELHDRIRLGCAQAFYAAVGRFPFAQEVRGENIFMNLRKESQGKWDYGYRKW